MISSKRKPKLKESDRRKELYNSIFQNFVNNDNIQHYSRNTSLGADFAEGYNRTIGDFLKRPVFEKSYCNWIDVLLTKTKQYNNRVHTSTMLTPVRASLKKNEGYVYNNLFDKRKKVEVSYNDLVRTANLKEKTLFISDSTSWSYKLFKITEIVKDTAPCNKIDTLPEPYNEALLKKTSLTVKETRDVMKNLISI